MSDVDANYYVDEISKEVVTYWVLKLLLKLNGHREFIDKDGSIRDDDIAYFLGLGAYVDDDLEIDKKEILSGLRDQLRTMEENVNFAHPPILTKNLLKVHKLLQLNPVEMDILQFTLYIHYYDIMESAGRTLNDLTTDKLEYAFSVLLDYSRQEIKQALSPKSKLAQSGLVMVDRSGMRAFQQKLDVLSNSFVDNMMTMDDDIEEMIKDSVRKCSPAELKTDDFEHLGTDMKLLIPYLKQAVKHKQTGVNVLFYGAPGTGKTELTKAIASEIDCEIYEVSYADEDDEPIEGYRRLKAYKVAQSFFAQKELVLMFDEVEDVFNNDDDSSIFGKKRQKNKAWINRILESNAIPAVWITNDIYSIDSALVRRFDMSIEIPIPPKRKRQEIIQNYSADFLAQQSIKKIAQDEHIAPALITRAAKVIESVKDVTEDTSKAFELLIDNTLKAQGYGSIKQGSETALPATYNPAYVNTTADLQEMAEGIKANPNARLCLYGVPGTGKSAFGKWIADMTERPFMLKKGSDLISMWVGGTEKNIANAFKEATDEDAVLVFDEVDSFLQDRRSAKQSWEVTQVNEMLVQMENFNGIFIATTNLMDGLDPASLRRFDLKLEFGYLKREQAWQLFLDEAKQLKLRKPVNTVKDELRKLNNLAPGDFAAVRRQHRFNPIANAMDLVKRLKEECVVKEDYSDRKMGFVA